MPDLHTGRYAAFIWPAYVLTAVVQSAMVAETLARARRWKARAEGEAAKRKDAPR